MAGCMFFVFFGAIGVLCVLWGLVGWFLPQCREGWLLYPGCPGRLTFVLIYLWLRGMGIVRCPLILLDLGLTPEDRISLASRGIEIYTVAELPLRLGIGAEVT